MKTKIAITLGAMALSALSGAAYAGSLTVPGETVGIAIGAPLPEGVYFVDTGAVGTDRALGDDGWLAFHIPVVAWSTPWELLGGRIEAYAAAPGLVAGRTNPSFFVAGMYNPALLVGEAWSLGNGWNFSQFFGGYAPIDNELGQDYWVFNSRSAITYNADNWDLTAHVIYGAVGDNLAGGPANGHKIAPDYVNLDLTATKTLGKWEVGAVAFGSWDVSGVSEPLGVTYAKQAQFAVGGLIGYNFTGISVQSYLTRDVWTENYFNPNGCKDYETRFWTRLVIPLWSPPAVEQVTYKK